jgi:hypothetical protein
MCRFTIRTLVDGLPTDHEEDREHVAEAYFSSTRDYVNRADQFHHIEVTVQLLSRGDLIYEWTKPSI